MDYQTKYIVIKLKLTKHKGFYHVPKFDKYAYAQQHGITLNGEPIVQYEDDNIILIFEGFPHTDERPPLGIYQG